MKKLTWYAAIGCASVILNSLHAAPKGNGNTSNTGPETGTGQAYIVISAEPSPVVEGQPLLLRATALSNSRQVAAPAGEAKFYLNGNGAQNMVGVATIVNGEGTIEFDTTGRANEVLNFRAHYQPPAPPPGQGFGASWSPEIQVTVQPQVDIPTCTGFTINTDLAGGPGFPAPGQTGEWIFSVKLKACTAVKNVSAQGGKTAWTSLVSMVPSKGDVRIRNDNKQNQVFLWTVGDMAAGEEQTLLITVKGTVNKSQANGTVLPLSGNWSALTTEIVDEVPVTTKTPYTDRVTVTVSTVLP